MADRTKPIVLIYLIFGSVATPAPVQKSGYILAREIAWRQSDYKDTTPLTVVLIFTSIKDARRRSSVNVTLILQAAYYRQNFGFQSFEWRK